MEKESLPPTPPQPDAADNPSKITIELEFNMLTSQCQMRSKAPTVVVLGVLRSAATIKPKEIAETEVGAARRVKIEYDLATEKGTAESDASPIIYQGILAYAESMITQNQLLQRLQGMAARGGGAQGIVRYPGAAGGGRRS